MKVSVVVPTYNEEANIARCLTSLNDQTMPRDMYEIIVVDGNSKDRTRDIAKPLADHVIIQKRKKVGGARNDGFDLASAEFVVTTDGDCIFPREWLDVIFDEFSRRPDAVTLYGPVFPIEKGLKNYLSLVLANTFSRLGYYSHMLYYTLGANTAFRRDAFLEAGGYRVSDAGDDLEIARRMKLLGKVVFISRMKVGFSMRRYDQYGALKSIYEWLYIVWKGGDADKYSYTQREYNKK
ncbi:glycosyl transferase [Methanomicrobiaceae archaeon CYW5]|uniref:glycosyltransferase n=1 Tax=Methanovulcanius yangii TaxID=1789227 RepID=UPI0029CA29AE|nr:glycosyltransferase [Methanovulcanius yangii]MBT8507271.1 glycosyl transferase [Methanovulcanius yangii]